MIIIGDSASMTKTISESDVYQFAGITGDFNPVHIDAVYAKESIFGERIAHGILVTGLISAVIGTKLPGVGTVYLEQDSKFVRPVRFGDTITATVTVQEIIKPDKGIVKLETKAYNQNNEIVIDGYAIVKTGEK